MFRVVVLTCVALVLVTVGVYGLRPVGDRADLAYVNSGGINTLDPAAITWKQDMRVALNVWEGLTTLNPVDSQPTAGASNLPTVSPDGLVYTFTIRPGARWSNGDPVQATDFIRGWRRAIEPGTAGDYAFFITDYVVGAAEYYGWRNAAVEELSSLEEESAIWRARFELHKSERDERFGRVGVRALDERRLEVRLTRRCAYFLDLCAFVTLLPVHQSIELLRVEYGGSGMTKEGLVVYDPQWTKPDYHRNGYPGLITNGAFVVESWQFKRRLRMRRNAYYSRAAGADVSGDGVTDLGKNWRRRHPPGGSPQVEGSRCDTIDMVVYGDLNTAIMAYEAGDLDFLPETDVTYAHELARLAMTGARVDFHNVPVFGTYFYLFNCADAVVDGRRNPFVDKRVRKAFALAVDKALIAEKVAGRGERPSNTVVPVGTVAGYESPAGLRYDPDQARRLLAAAGYPGGAGLAVIDLLYNTGFVHGKICAALAEMWRRELGAVVAPRGKEVKTFAEDRKQRRFMISRAGWYGDYADPTTFLEVFVTGNGNNDSGHSDATFDDLMRRSGEAASSAERFALLREAERRVVGETVAVLPLYQYTQLLAIKPYVQGLYPNARLMFPFRGVSVRR